MAFPCVLGYKAECDGCGACTEERIAGQCDECKEDIFEGETIYNLDGILLHEDCLLDYVRLFRRTAEYME
ncbi:MAG: hypothetical protein IJE08_07370 [Clostridia bacterium]|nr:hypothetical protein [Clostridia bacterium]